MSNFDRIPTEIYDDIKHLSPYMLYGSRDMASRPAVSEFEHMTTETFIPAEMIGSKILKETDYDFAVPDTPANREVLMNNEFDLFEDQLYYRDDVTSAVYVKKYYPHLGFNKTSSRGPGDMHVVNVVLKNDYPLFRQVWYSIDPEFYHDFLWKRGPNYEHCKKTLTKAKIRNIMNQLFRTARHMI